MCIKARALLREDAAMREGMARKFFAQERKPESNQAGGRKDSYDLVHLVLALVQPTTPVFSSVNRATT